VNYLAQIHEMLPAGST